MKKNLFIGTSGYSYKGWEKDFYPKELSKKEYLSYYAKKFNTVEINNSFYKTLKSKTVENWKNQINNNFIFSFKAHRYITQFKKLKDIDEENLDKVYSPLSTFNKRKHIILFQFPKNFSKSKKRLVNLFNLLAPNFRYAFEFRHESWFRKEIYKLLEKNNSALVMSDAPPDKEWPKENIETTDFFYIRFHGSKELYASSYTNKELESYANIIKKKLNKGLKVYSYFNNDINGYALKNTKTLKKLLQQS